ncbi:NADH-quinone oxidoreductase subunit I [Allomyces macrogynus ATCC 38327]|uniref:NADH-quinone oxidoreductase subunit I n=1 Tax=Allomyces macrogynus (strain ATCC 38327) TaxID=578462 RepID=A0A0L0SA87_ALLM3|nr:NADH-quinone oxidoreductase subunit I [Allomyces macrogynus ATCC 38327]|eukprot:KNE59310.1 NADH-quinone oxidoreductase subunit I [Allomyces macrogynus ATCC 38327]
MATNASVRALADPHHAAQHAAALAAQRAHQAGTRRLRTLRADRDVKVSDLAELERATTDLHALKQALAQDPRFLVAQVEPVVHAKDKVVETWEADAARLEAARAGVAERARAEVVETVREHVTVDRNQALSEYFSTVTVPLHTSMERMRAELERQRAEQARLAEEADELEVKLAKAKRNRGRDPDTGHEPEHHAHAPHRAARRHPGLH